MPGPPSTASSTRLGYLDWLRGIAVLIMIEAHTLDSWTRADDRTSALFGKGIILGGMGAPLFLFLAGVAVALAADSRERRGRTPAEAARSVRRRGWEIFGLAFLFRLQSFVLSPGASLSSLLKVDVLNVMGPAIVAAAALWQVGKTMIGRVLLLGGLVAVLSMVTPLVRSSHAVALLPDVLEAYVRPVPGRTTFTFLPWGGFVLAGTVAGLVVARSRRSGAAGRVMAGFALAGVAMAAAGYVASLQPSIYRSSSFWTSSPAFFLFRVGLLTASVPFAWLWSERRAVFLPWSPVRVLGESSLFVYWIHVEMVYGVMSQPLHRALPLAGTAAAYVVFTLFLLALVLVKNRWRGMRRPSGAPVLRAAQSLPR